jgi:hypothetical protein
VDSNAWRYNLVAFDRFSLNILVITFTMQPVPGSDTPHTAQFIARDVDGTHMDQYGAAAAAANEATWQPDAAGTSQLAQEQQQQHHQEPQDAMMDLLERFQALSHDERETIRQAMFPQLSSQQPAQKPSQHPNQQAAPVLRGTAVQQADPVQIDFRVQPLQLHEKNLPPPDPKYDGSTYWGRYAQTVQQWLVASNTPTWLWGVRALASLSGEASDYLHQQLLEADLSYEQVVSNPQLLPWSKLDQLRSSGNFGSPPTDNSVRDKLCSFQQRKQSGKWNTPRHLSKVLSIIQQASNSSNSIAMQLLLASRLAVAAAAAASSSVVAAVHRAMCLMVPCRASRASRLMLASRASTQLLVRQKPSVARMLTSASSAAMWTGGHLPRTISLPAPSGSSARTRLM